MIKNPISKRKAVISGPVTSNSASSSQKKQTTPKNGHFRKGQHSKSKDAQFEDANYKQGKKATGVRPGRDVDVSDGEQHSRDEPSATTGKGTEDIKTG